MSTINYADDDVNIDYLSAKIINYTNNATAKTPKKYDSITRKQNKNV